MIFGDQHLWHHVHLHNDFDFRKTSSSSAFEPVMDGFWSGASFHILLTS